MKKKILILCSYARDIRELSRVEDQQNYEFIFEPSSKLWLKNLCDSESSKEKIFAEIEMSIDAICNYCINNGIDAIISSCDYPANIMRTAIINKLNLPGPSLESILSLEHKYYSRLLQLKHVHQAVPSFCLTNNTQKIKRFPVLIKPVKSSFGHNAFVVNSKDEFIRYVKKVPLPEKFLYPFNYFLKRFSYFEYDACNSIIEDFLSGYQTTVDGFIQNGEVTILGIVDSLMFPGTISFSCFEYPSCLEQDVQNRMIEITKQVIMRSGLNNTLFNVECIYNPEMNRVYIIEINPRITSQFAGLFERVDGFNTYEILIDIALGKKPKIYKKQGAFNVAASCVLRFFDDKFVQKIPSDSNVQKIKELFPDMDLEIFAKPGNKLSDEEQDSKSFRYGLIYLGAYDRQDLLNRFEICQDLLDFKFKDV